MPPPLKAIHRKDALHLATDGEDHTLHFWKISTADIIVCPESRIVKIDIAAGTVLVRLSRSGQLRKFRLICLHMIDDLRIFF